jgi:hypothetical protein
MEDKKGQGRPKEPRKVRFVQMHDAFTPLQMAPIMSLSTFGEKAMATLVESWNGIHVIHPKGREFIVPYGNISFYELEND